ncbi:MAG TPA: hypothetical protein VHM26_03705 [Chitinophagaceae bacterium]|jgi:hypothetical protein|nr:hypothetical protein [Chitinophagaceae bacterium]
MEAMILNKDKFLLGFILGLIGPVVGFVVIYFINYSGLTFSEFLEFFMNDKRTITSVGTLSLLANAIIFAIYVHFNKYNTFKGIFLATVIYGIGILILKVFV